MAGSNARLGRGIGATSGRYDISLRSRLIELMAPTPEGRITGVYGFPERRKKGLAAKLVEAIAGWEWPFLALTRRSRSRAGCRRQVTRYCPPTAALRQFVRTLRRKNHPPRYAHDNCCSTLLVPSLRKSGLEIRAARASPD